MRRHGSHIRVSGFTIGLGGNSSCFRKAEILSSFKALDLFFYDPFWTVSVVCRMCLAAVGTFWWTVAWLFFGVCVVCC